MKSSASLQHLPNHTHQRPIFQRRRNSLFISQLLIHFLGGAMSALFNTNIDTEPRRQGLFETNSHTKTDHGCQAAVRDGRGN